MINVQYWLMYHPYYDSECELGQTIRNAQKESIERENKGVPVDSNMMDKAFPASGNSAKCFPHLYSNTTDMDFREAMFVMDSEAVVYADLKRFWITAGSADDDAGATMEFNTGYDDEIDDEYDDESIVTDNMALVRDGTEIELTAGAKRLHYDIEHAGKDRSGPPSDALKAEVYKTIKETYDLMVNDKFCTEQDLLDYMSSDVERRHKYLEAKSSQVGYQKNGGGYVMLKRSPVKTVTKREKRLKGWAG